MVSDRSTCVTWLGHTLRARPLYPFNRKAISRDATKTQPMPPQEPHQSPFVPTSASCGSCCSRGTREDLEEGGNSLAHARRILELDAPHRKAESCEAHGHAVVVVCADGGVAKLVSGAREHLEAISNLSHLRLVKRATRGGG